MRKTISLKEIVHRVINSPNNIFIIFKYSKGDILMLYYIEELNSQNGFYCFKELYKPF